MASASVREERKSLSRLLKELCEDPEEHITLGQIIQALGRRSFGALLFIFALPNILPLPPGSTTVLGLPILVLAPQVAIGLRSPWLPSFIKKRQIKASEMEHLFGRFLPTLERIEKLSRPRLTFLYGPIGDRIIGVICTLLALVLILPVPLGNLAPSFTIAVLSLGLFQRDGVIGLVGYLALAGSIGLLVLGYAAFLFVIRQGLQLFGVEAPF